MTMTPNPDSPKFIRHEIPDNASIRTLRLREDYKLLRANIEACVWPHITSGCLRLDYNTYDGRVRITVGFTDKNKHSHTFSILSYRSKRLQCEYEFEGSVNVAVVSLRSYAEWLMLQLWQFKIDAELCKCDRGLVISTNIDNAYNVMSKMLDIVTNNIKPIDWFLSKEPVWQFHQTYNDLLKILPLLQEEASKNRWKDVKAENFRLVRNADCALICLDYTDSLNYTMQFRLGMTWAGFASERTDKFMDMFYHFENHAPNEELREYFDKENREFSKIANAILEIPFSWKALMFHSDDGFYINTYRENAFQKYCLMLDLIIPFKNRYEATEAYIAPEILETKKQLEASLSTDLKIAEEQESDRIFTHGHFLEPPILDSSEEFSF